MSFVGDLPSIDAINRLIERAQSCIAVTDFRSLYRSRVRRDGSYRTRRRRDPERSAIRFHQTQGWELPTSRGRGLDEEVQAVGRAIEARALGDYRRASGLALDDIAAMSRTDERMNLLLEALSIGTTCPSTFTARSDYRARVEGVLAHVESQLTGHDRATVGDGRQLDLDDPSLRRTYARVQKVLAAERDGFSSDDVAQRNAWDMNEARLDSLARVRVLRDDLGILHGDVPQQWATAEETVESAYAFLPSTWVERIRGTFTVSIDSKRSAWLPPGNGRRMPRIDLHSHLCGSDGSMHRRVAHALHELGHHLEYTFPEINHIARAHKAIRTLAQDGTLLPLERLAHDEPVIPADAPERMVHGMKGWVRPGGFAAAYCGCETNPLASEIFSTGLEATLGGRYGGLRGHGGMTADPQHVHLTLGLVATVRR